MRFHGKAVLAGVLLLVASVNADDEVSNRFYLQSERPWGAVYAKCDPSELHGTKGKTRLYHATRDEDKLLFEFPWYSQNIYLQGTAWGLSVVRFGPWPKGQKASADDLAVEFYLNDKLLKSYSTLDIAGSEEAVSRSVSHYSVFAKIGGYRWVQSNDYAFDVTTTDGRTLSFNVQTGQLLQ